MSLQVWMPFHETSIKNIGSNGQNFTGANVSTSSGKTGTCLVFNGSNSQVYGNVDLTQNMTFACWLKFNATGSYHIIDCRATSGETGLQPMYGGTSYGLQCYSSAGGSYTWSASTCGFTTGVWYHLAVTITPSNATLYINGVSKGTQSGTFGSNFGIRTMKIGTRCSNANWLNGAINDVRVYNHILSNVEIRNLSRALVLHYDFENLYTPVEYIEFTGTQFIRTGINSLTAPYRVETTFNKTNTETSDQCLFGQRQLGKFSNIYNTYFENDPLGVSASGTAPNNTKATLAVTNTSVSLSGKELISSSSVGNRSTSYEALIGAFSEDSYANAKWFFKGKIYEVKILNAGSLYRHYIPVRRTIDGKLGLLDKVNNIFYANSGSGDFTTSNSSISGKVLDCSGNGADANLQTPSAFSISTDTKTGTISLRNVSGNASARINTSLNPSFIAGTGTICFWYKKDSSAFNYNSGNFLVATQSSAGQWIGATQNGQPFNSGSSYGTFYLDAVAGANSAVSDTNWHFYCFTGVNLSSWTSFSMQAHGDTSWLWRGNIADFRIYNTNLSASDIKELYEVRGMIDDKGNAYCDGVASASNFNLSNTGVLKSDDISTGANNFSLCGGYTRLDYIQSTGTQYIDTGFTPNQDTKIEVKYTSQTTASGSEFVFGSRTTYNQAGISHCVNFNSKFFAQYNNVYTTVGGTYTVDKIENVTFDKNKIYFDGALNYTFTYANFTAPHSLLLFACYSANQGGLLGQSHIKMYSCKIWDNNKLVRDYIPVKRNSDNVVGMYENVNGVFYANSGTGTFTAGTSCGSLNSISCNNFYKDGGACVADYELTQFNRTSWHTLWTGNTNISFAETDRYDEPDGIATLYIVEGRYDMPITFNSTGKIRLTGRWNIGGSWTTLSAVELPISYNKGNADWYLEKNNNTSLFAYSEIYDTVENYQVPYVLNLTKIEQYY